MRIIGGEFGGHVFRPKMNKWPTRPTTDRARESLFNILENRIDFSQIEMLDLFSGTGMIGLEALSRGAKKMTFIDRWRESIEFIRSAVKAIGLEERCTIVKEDALRFIKKNTDERWDLIFIDPPYDFNKYQEVVEIVLEENHLNQDGLLIVEHDGRNSFTNHNRFIGERKYGQTYFSFFE